MSTGKLQLTIGELAKAAGVGVETVRFYQRKGLLRRPPRPAAGISRYGETDQSRLTFIKSAQKLGFSLDEVAELLRLDDGSGCRQAQIKGEAKLADVRSRLADLLRIESVLTDLLSQCGNASGRIRCPLIAALQKPLLA